MDCIGVVQCIVRIEVTDSGSIDKVSVGEKPIYEIILRK